MEVRSQTPAAVDRGDPPDPGRRQAMIQLLGMAAGLAAVGGLGWASHHAAVGRLGVTHPQLSVPRWPTTLAGLRVAHLSDLHVDFTGEGQARRAVEAANAAQPDLIVLTGDFITRADGTLDALVPLLSSLRAPHGVFACLGNHDYMASTAPLIRTLERCGIEVLVNRAMPIMGGQLHMVGIDDGLMGRPDLAGALRSVPEGAPVMLLAHEPDLADHTGPLLAQRGHPAVQLSGHSHGGQVRLPIVGATVLPRMGRRYPMGTYLLDDLAMYVSRGVGVSGVPFRLACPAEVAIHTLT